MLRHDDLGFLIDGFISHATSMVRPPATVAVQQMSLLGADSRAVLVPDEELAIASGHTRKLLANDRALALASRFELSADADKRVQVIDPDGRAYDLAAIAMFRIDDEIGSSLAQMTSVLLNHSDVPGSMSQEMAIDLAAAVAATIPINQFERGGGRVLRFAEQFLS